jgi:hypothetical protein
MMSQERLQEWVDQLKFANAEYLKSIDKGIQINQSDDKIMAIISIMRHNQQHIDLLEDVLNDRF